MASPKQIAANRANAKKSTGPRTPEGKAVSRFNALKFGITAESLLLPNESADDFEALAVEYADRFRPQSPEQRFLVKSLLTADWFTDRLNRTEPIIWAHDYATPVAIGEQAERGGAFIFQHYSRLRRCHSALHRTYLATMKELRAEGIQPVDAAPEPEAELGSFCNSSQPIPTEPADGPPPLAAAQQDPQRMHLVPHHNVPQVLLPPVSVQPLEEVAVSSPKPSPAPMPATPPEPLALCENVDLSRPPRRPPPKSPRMLRRLPRHSRRSIAAPHATYSDIRNRDHPAPKPEPYPDVVVAATSQPPPASRPSIQRE